MTKLTTTYLGVPVKRPRVGFFEFSSCEGCQLQLLNDEDRLLDFLSLLDIVNFREAMDGGTENYEIAFVEGSITRRDQEERLKEIRGRAKLLVAFGTCACFGGVNRLVNRFHDLGWVRETVYGDYPIETDDVRAVPDVVPVDLRIYGCPVKKEEVEGIVTNLVVGKAVRAPTFPVCMECKARENICLFDLGDPCLGPVTRAGCDAWCPSSRCGCWGCRGPAEGANMEEMIALMDRRGISRETILDRLECFGGFEPWARGLRSASGGAIAPKTGRISERGEIRKRGGGE